MLMKPEDLENRYRWMYREFYSWKNILKRFPDSQEQRTAYLMFNLLYRKFGLVTAGLGDLIGVRNFAVIARSLSYDFGQRSYLLLVHIRLRAFRYSIISTGMPGSTRMRKISTFFFHI